MVKRFKIRKLIAILLAGLLLLIVLGGVGLFFVNRYLNSPGFLNKVRDEAQSSLGFPIELDSLRVSLFRGISLRRLSLASPPPGASPLLKLEEIRISYSLLPLLHKNLQINEILLVRPRFDLKLNKRGELELPLKPSSPRPRESKGRPSRSKQAPPASSPWTVEVKALRIKSGSGRFIGPEYSFSVAGLNLNGHLRRTPDSLHFQGKVTFKRAEFNRQTLLRDVSFSLRGAISSSASRRTITCETLSGKLWEGNLTGRVAIRSEGDDLPLSIQAALSFKDIQSRLILLVKGGVPPVQGPVSGELTVKGDLLPARGLWPEVRGEIVSPRLQLKSVGVLTDLKIPIILAEGELKAEPITASLAGGSIKAEFKSDLKGAPHYPFAARLDLSDLNVAEILKASPELKEALGENTRLTGFLCGEATGEGRLSQADQLQARGEVSIREGSLSGNSYQETLFQLTGQKRLQKIKFDQARAEFTFARKVFDLTRLIIHSYRVKITSSGSVDLNRSNYLKFKVGLNFHTDLIKDIKPKEFQYALKPIDPDPNYRGIEFHLWGVPGKIKSDYQKVLLQRGAAGWLTDEFLTKDKKENSSSGRDDKEQMIEDGVNMLFKIFQ